MSSVIRSYSLCRLCLHKHPEVEMIKLFNAETNELETHISSILVAHLWFLIIENDEHSKLICLKCWQTIKQFHLFYVQIKNAQKDLFNTINLSTIAAAGGNNRNVGGINFINEQKQQIIKLEDINDDTSSSLFGQQPNVAIKVEEVISEPDLKLIQKATETKKSKARTTRNKKSNLNVRCITPVELEKKHFVVCNEEDHSFSDSSIPSPAPSPALLDSGSESSRSQTPESIIKTINSSIQSSSNIKAKIKRKRTKIKSSKSIVDQKKNNDNDDVISDDDNGQNNDEFNQENDSDDDDECEDQNVVSIKKKRRTTKKTTTEKGPMSVSSEKQKEIDENNIKLREYYKMECNLCQHPFKCYREIKNHYRIAHDQKRGYLTCCGGHKFYLLHQMLDHIALHINPDEFKCKECGRKYSNRSQYSNHIKDHDPNIERLQCDQCPRTFRKKFDLSHHKRMRHYTEDDKKFPCETCGKKFLTVPFLSKHIERIHKRTPYGAEVICDICAKEFTSKYSLGCHMLEHLNIERPKLQCNICERWFKTKGSLRGHMSSHRDAPSKCPYCEKILRNPQARHNHVKKVHQERSYKCTICDKGFKNAVTLREHIASHTGQDLYACPYCTQTFKSNANMHHHRKKVHTADFERDRGKRMLKKLYCS